MIAKLRPALGVLAAIGVVVAFVALVAALMLSTFDHPGREQAERDQRETSDLLAMKNGQQKTPYFDIKSPTAVKIVARGMQAPYEVLSPGSQTNCTIFPTGQFSRVGDVIVGKRFLVSYDKAADTGTSDECAAGSLFLWGPIDQPSLGHAVGNTPNGK